MISTEFHRFLTTILVFIIDRVKSTTFPNTRKKKFEKNWTDVEGQLLLSKFLCRCTSHFPSFLQVCGLELSRVEK